MASHYTNLEFIQNVCVSMFSHLYSIKVILWHIAFNVLKQAIKSHGKHSFIRIESAFYCWHSNFTVQKVNFHKFILYVKPPKIFLDHYWSRSHSSLPLSPLYFMCLFIFFHSPPNSLYSMFLSIYALSVYIVFVSCFSCLFCLFELCVCLSAHGLQFSFWMAFIIILHACRTLKMKLCTAIVMFILCPGCVCVSSTTFKI